MHLKSQLTGAEATLPRLTDDFFCPSYKIIYVYWKSGFARITPESDFDAFFNKKNFIRAYLLILRHFQFLNLAPKRILNKSLRFTDSKTGVGFQIGQIENEKNFKRDLNGITFGFGLSIYNFCATRDYQIWNLFFQILVKTPIEKNFHPGEQRRFVFMIG